MYGLWVTNRDIILEYTYYTIYKLLNHYDSAFYRIYTGSILIELSYSKHDYIY